MIRRLLLGLSLCALAGCTAAPFGDKATKAIDTLIDTGISDRKHYNDKKGEVLTVLPCDISLGAYYRMDNTVKQEALQMLCSGRRLGEPTPQLGVGEPAVDPNAAQPLE